MNKNKKPTTQEMSMTSLGSHAACPSLAFALFPPCLPMFHLPLISHWFVVALLFRLAWLLAVVVLGAGVVAVGIHPMSRYSQRWLGCCIGFLIAPLIVIVIPRPIVPLLFLPPHPIVVPSHVFHSSLTVVN